VVERIKDLTNGAGADRIVEVDAAANVRFLPNIIARDGLYVVYGSGTSETPFSFGPMITVGAAARFFIVYELAPAVREQIIRALNAYLRAGSLTHRVTRTFALDIPSRLMKPSRVRGYAWDRPGSSGWSGEFIVVDKTRMYGAQMIAFRVILRDLVQLRASHA